MVCGTMSTQKGSGTDYFKTTFQPVDANGDDAGIPEIEVEIEFYWEAEQVQTLEQEGIPARVELERVLDPNGVDILPTLTKEQADALVEEIENHEADI